MIELRNDEKGALSALLQLAVDHHDPAKPEVVADIPRLAATAAPTLKEAIFAAVLGNPEVVGLLLKLLLGGGKLTPSEPPVTVVAPKPAGPAPAPTAPQAPAVAAVGRVVLKLHTVLGPARTGSRAVPYVLEDDGTIRLAGDTTSLDDKSTLWLDLEVVDAAGKGIRIDLDPAKTPAGEVNRAEFLGLQVYIAEDAETGEELGRIGGKGLGGDLGHVDNGVSFVPNRYAESGGMAANARIKRKGGPIRIYAEVADVESNSLTTPEVR